jgi:UDP-N-acetylmuramate dehydrogenase
MLRVNEFRLDRSLAEIPNLALEWNADLSSRTWMETQARASVLAQPRSVQALKSLLCVAREREWPLLMLGKGANTIFATHEFEGVVVELPRTPFGEVTYLGDHRVQVGAGVAIGQLLTDSRKFGLMGLEFMTMIPGVVGGALAGNAGAGNWGLCDFVEEVVVMQRDGQIKRLKRGDVRFGYRFSELSEHVILLADLRLEPLDEKVSADRVVEFREKKKCQPYKEPSSGCIFKNPRDSQTGKHISAGKLIDDAGMKSYMLNSVKVSEKHANFLINTGGATGEDFLAMISLIQDTIREKFGYELEVEARIVGGPLTSCVLR